MHHILDNQTETALENKIKIGTMCFQVTMGTQRPKRLRKSGMRGREHTNANS